MRANQTELKRVGEATSRMEKQIELRSEVFIDHEQRLSVIEQRRDAKRRAQLLSERLNYQGKLEK